MHLAAATCSSWIAQGGTNRWRNCCSTRSAWTATR
jgi:hypothetical protein